MVASKSISNWFPSISNYMRILNSWISFHAYRFGVHLSRLGSQLTPDHLISREHPGTFPPSVPSLPLELVIPFSPLPHQTSRRPAELGILSPYLRPRWGHCFHLTASRNVNQLGWVGNHLEIDIDQSHTQVSTISHVIKHEDLQIMIVMIWWVSGACFHLFSRFPVGISWKSLGKHQYKARKMSWANYNSITAGTPKCDYKIEPCTIPRSQECFCQVSVRIFTIFTLSSWN